MPDGLPKSKLYDEITADQKKALAREARDFIVYAAQEGEAQDVRQFIHSLDEEKLVAFIEEYGPLPEELFNLVAEDTRNRVRELLGDNDKLAVKLHEWLDAQGLTPGDIVRNGRKTVVNVLGNVNRLQRDLESNEMPAVQNMAGHIPDYDVIKALLPLAEKYPSIGVHLLQNPGFNDPGERIQELGGLNFDGVFKTILKAAEKDPKVALDLASILNNSNLTAQTGQLPVEAMIEVILPHAKNNYQLAYQLAINPRTSLRQASELMLDLVRLADQERNRAANDLVDVVGCLYPHLNASRLPEDLNRADEEVATLISRMRLNEATVPFADGMEDYYLEQREIAEAAQRELFTQTETLRPEARP